MFDLPFGGADDESATGSDRPSTGGGAGTDDGDRFVPSDEFDPETLPEPGGFLRAGGATVATGDDHVRIRDDARELFEERGVRDATFGYVLTKLDRDRNHPDAGFRYATDGDELRVEFTPTTGFCPQGGALALASFRAWNADPGAHGFDVVRVRIDGGYHASEPANRRLEAAEEEFRATGTLPGQAGGGYRP